MTSEQLNGTFNDEKILKSINCISCYFFGYVFFSGFNLLTDNGAIVKTTNLKNKN
jgi:hypothetical protein